MGLSSITGETLIVEMGIWSIKLVSFSPWKLREKSVNLHRDFLTDLFGKIEVQCPVTWINLHNRLFFYDSLTKKILINFLPDIVFLSLKLIKLEQHNALLSLYFWRRQKLESNNHKYDWYVHTMELKEKAKTFCSMLNLSKCTL